MEDEFLIGKSETGAPARPGDLQSVLHAHRRGIDARLAALLPVALPDQAPLGAAMRDGVLAPGKRLRPLLAILAAEALGGDGGVATDAGCALEMVHAASLVLDDLPAMDDARLRRGRPAVHVAHGEDVAVLAAMAVLTGAFRVVAGIEAASPLARVEMVAILADAVGPGGLVGGQFNDLRGGRGERPLSEIQAANGLKTGALFRAAAEIGGVVSDADPGTRAMLRAFADELGQAFQLLDDLLDRSASAVSIGKDVGKDADKSTIVSLLGHRSAAARLERHLARARAQMTELFGADSRLHGFVEAIFADASGASITSGASAAARREHEAGAL